MTRLTKSGKVDRRFLASGSPPPYMPTLAEIERRKVEIRAKNDAAKKATNGVLPPEVAKAIEIQRRLEELNQ